MSCIIVEGPYPECASVMTEALLERSSATGFERVGTYDVEIASGVDDRGRDCVVFSSNGQEVDRYVLDDGFVSLLSDDHGDGRFFLFSGVPDSVLSVDVASVVSVVDARVPAEAPAMFCR